MTLTTIDAGGDFGLATIGITKRRAMAAKAMNSGVATAFIGGWSHDFSRTPGRFESPSLNARSKGSVWTFDPFPVTLTG